MVFLTYTWTPDFVDKNGIRCFHAVMWGKCDYAVGNAAMQMGMRKCDGLW